MKKQKIQQNTQKQATEKSAADEKQKESRLCSAPRCAACGASEEFLPVNGNEIQQTNYEPDQKERKIDLTVNHDGSFRCP